MISKKNRLTKECELKKNIVTLNNLKKKLAMSIVNKTVSKEDIRELSMAELYKHAEQMDKERIERRKVKLAYNMMVPGPEKERIAEQQWQRKVTGNIQAQIQHYSSNFDHDADLDEEQLDLIRLKTKLTDQYSYV